MVLYVSIKTKVNCLLNAQNVFSMAKKRQTPAGAKGWQCQINCKKYKNCTVFRLSCIMLVHILFSTILRAWLIRKYKGCTLKGNTYESTLLITKWLERGMHVINVHWLLETLPMESSIFIIFFFKRGENNNTGSSETNLLQMSSEGNGEKSWRKCISKQVLLSVDRWLMIDYR